MKCLSMILAVAAVFAAASISVSAAPEHYDSFTNETGTYSWELEGVVLEGKGENSGAEPQVTDYGDLKISISGNKDAANEYVKDGEIHWNYYAGTSEGKPTDRYIEYTPEYDGVMSFTARRIVSKEVTTIGIWTSGGSNPNVEYYSTTDGSPAKDISYGTETGTNVKINMKEGVTYMIYPVTGGIDWLNNIKYTVGSKKVTYNGSPETITVEGNDGMAFYGKANVIGGDVENVGFVISGTANGGGEFEGTVMVDADYAKDDDGNFGVIVTDLRNIVSGNGSVTAKYYTGE